jgi:hypothetical protein
MRNYGLRLCRSHQLLQRRPLESSYGGRSVIERSRAHDNGLVHVHADDHDNPVADAGRAKGGVFARPSADFQHRLHAVPQRQASLRQLFHEHLQRRDESRQDWQRLERAGDCDAAERQHVPPLQRRQSQQIGDGISMGGHRRRGRKSLARTLSLFFDVTTRQGVARNAERTGRQRVRGDLHRGETAEPTDI